MSFVNTPMNPEVREHENGRLRMELMRLRSAKTKSADDDERTTNQFKWNRADYEGGLRDSGVHFWAVIDPNRRVATEWKKLASFDKIGFWPLFWDNEPTNFEP